MKTYTEMVAASQKAAQENRIFKGPKKTAFLYGFRLGSEWGGTMDGQKLCNTLFQEMYHIYWNTTAPFQVIRGILEKSGFTREQIDLASTKVILGGS